jgi:hypothetical protein
VNFHVLIEDDSFARAGTYDLLPTYIRNFSSLSGESCLYCDGLSSTTGSSGESLIIPCKDGNHGNKSDQPNLLSDLFDMDHVWIDILHKALRLTDRIELFLQKQAVESGIVRELETAFLEQCNIKYHHWEDEKQVK